MKTHARHAVLALLANLTLLSITSSLAVANGPKALLLNPGSNNGLPKFGFQSFNIAGVGERITFVQWGGRAAKLGFEPGDVILSLNGFPLTYHGSWNDAMYQTLSNGGWVSLKVRDVHTGFVAMRQTFVGGIVGPIDVYSGDYCDGPYYGNYPYGPITSKSHKNPKGNGHFHGSDNVSVKDIVELFDHNKKKKP